VSVLKISRVMLTRPWTATVAESLEGRLMTQMKI
jgi:hypothetical protein